MPQVVEFRTMASTPPRAQPKPNCVGLADTSRCRKFQGIRLMASLSQRCSLHVRSHNGPALKLYVSLLRFKVEKVERDYYAVN